MATRYPSDRDEYSRVQPGISRGGQGARRPASAAGSNRSGSAGRGGARGASSSARRPSSPQRTSSAQRSSAQRPSSQRPSSSRPAGRSNRRRPNRTPVFAALAAVVVIVLVLVIAKPFGRGADRPVNQVADIPASNPVDAGNAPAEVPQEQTSLTPQYEDLADKLADMDADVGSLSADEMAKVSDLSINTNLPDTWLNVLLLGTDERVLNDSARTDAIMIASINRTTGEVKLTSIMRDLAIEYTDIGKYNGTYRINAANFFGGPNLAMRTINEKFQMNIQYYVMVNFYGFQRVAEKLGGIDIDITEEEMNQINHWVYNVYKSANNNNVDISDLEWAKLEQYGQNVHLNGTQTLGYARIRKLQGGDYMRSQRQRTVLGKLLEKVKKLDAVQMAALATDMLKDVKTNLPVNDLFPLAVQVCSNGLTGIESLQLPIARTYKEETRNNKSMLFDCDFQANAVQLYNFIYE